MRMEKAPTKRQKWLDFHHYERRRFRFGIPDGIAAGDCDGG